MKAIVVYSSKTGRIQQIAQAMAQVLPQGTPCVPVDEMPSDFPIMTAYSWAFGLMRTRQTLRDRKR